MIISASNAEFIAQEACRKAHLEEISKYRIRENDLAEECWEQVFPAAVREIVLAMPEGWLRLDKCLRFNAGGWSIHLDHAKGLPVPYRTSCGNLGTLTGELADRARAFVVERDKKKEERAKEFRDLRAAILAARTYKQLSIAWPEGLPYFEAYLPQSKNKPSTAVAIPFAKLNEALGLSAKEAINDAR